MDATTPILLPPIQPLFDHPLRDTSICLAPDGSYYLTGTTGHPTWWTSNEGIHLWHASELHGPWESLGLVWALDRDGTWQRERDPQGNVAVWAPEIHYLNGTFWLTFSLAWNYPGRSGGRSGLLKSTSGRAEGPYVDVAGEPLVQAIDASLFQDDNGAVYWIYQNGMIARMSEEMTALAEEPRLLAPTDHEHVGFEGAFVTKIDGRYHLLAADLVAQDGTWMNYVGGEVEVSGADYSCFAAVADHLYGPYGPRYLAIPHAGHNMLFSDKQGRWWSTLFGNTGKPPFRERPGIVAIDVDAAGRIQAAAP